MLKPKTGVEQRIFELWADLNPGDAYAQGVDEHAGTIFIPSASNVTRVLKKIDRLKAKAKDRTERKFLASLRTRLLFPEPAHLPYTILEAFFSHMLKEGVVADHVASLALQGTNALETGIKEARRKDWPPGMRALTLIACHGLSAVLDVVEEETNDEAARAAVRSLRVAVGRYQKDFKLAGFRPDAGFDELYEVYRTQGCDLGRSRYFARALRDLWDYTETPAEVEAAGLRMLRREGPRFQELVKAKSKELGCRPTAESVQKALAAKRGVDQKSILPFLVGVREHAARIADKYIVRINPKYTTQVIETPPYLVNMTPSGAAYGLDTLTDRAREIFLATTNVRSTGLPSPAELLNLIVHEEYGHCVHGSNSANAYAGSPGLLDLVNSSFVCVSEGIAFQRELEFLPILKGIAAGTLQGPHEKAFVRFLEAWGGIDEVTNDYEFLTYLWRIVRFLRVIGDARINSGKQDLVEFIEWAHRRTGLRKATIYYNLFPAHQVLGPGYASTYAIIAERIGEIQAEALKRGKDLRTFNAYACSIGWPPKSVFEAKLEAWVRSNQ